MDICHKDTKNRENLDKLYKKAKSKKQKNRERSEKLPDVRKNIRRFFFYGKAALYPGYPQDWICESRVTEKVN